KEAVSAYLRALDADPRMADAHYNLSRLYEQLGDEAAAVRHLRAYRSLTQGTGRACAGATLLPQRAHRAGLDRQRVQRVHEGCHDLRIELTAALRADLLERFLERPGKLVRSRVHQCVERVDERNDAAAHRDVGTARSIVAETVPALVVRERDFLCDLQQRHDAAAEDARADRRVRLDQREFLGGEP